MSDGTSGEDYARRLQAKQQVWWKRALNVQAPYQWNLRRQQLGRTLDVGCGIGRNLETLAVGSVGVDHNAHSVAVARERGVAALTVDEWEASDLRARICERPHPRALRDWRGPGSARAPGRAPAAAVVQLPVPPVGGEAVHLQRVLPARRQALLRAPTGPTSDQSPGLSSGLVSSIRRPR